MSEYTAIKAKLARGWNTWNTRSVLSHVLLPQGFAINLCIKEYAGRRYLKEALIGRHGEEDERIVPGLHAYDGSYSELRLQWQGIEVTVQSATSGQDLVLLVTPHKSQKRPALLIAETGLLWNRPGILQQDDKGIKASLPGGEIRLYATQPADDDPYLATQTPSLAMRLTGPIGLTTGKPRSLAEIYDIVSQQEQAQRRHKGKFGELAEVYNAIQTCLAWDTIYEPEHDRVVSPVSRLWNVHWGGFVLFDWDTYFAALMCALDNKELAYANAIEITREKTERGFIPNFGTVCNLKSRDRSQPPVGSRVILELYKRFGERWLLEETFEDLLTWNRWWTKHRQHDHLLCWGSDPYEPLVDAQIELWGLNTLQGAAFESGLDNSPMYDDIPFDANKNLMQLADVGLNGMYIMDCEALAEIAAVIGRKGEAEELRQRGDTFRRAMSALWDERSGIFLNRLTDSGEFNHRLSPTSFYALLGRAATPAQAQRMIREHFYNPAEFWGDWILPSIARNDPAFADQNYWRGRIWGPMNFLVYLGLLNYDLPQARKDLAEKSRALLMKNWLEHGYVCENYSAITGEGGEIANSDRYYHWGGLLGLPALIEAGYLNAQ